MKKILLALALTVVGFSAMAAGGPRSGGTSGPTVSFNADTGAGYVAKRVLFGYDPSAVTFSYQLTTSYTAVCTWDDKSKTRYPFTSTKGYVVNSQLDISGSRHLYSGFKLTGFGSYVESGDNIPVLGAICQKGRGGTWTEVTQVGAQGGLYWIYGSVATLLQ
jgi:hypothetical protein